MNLGGAKKPKADEEEKESTTPEIWANLGKDLINLYSGLAENVPTDEESLEKLRSDTKLAVDAIKSKDINELKALKVPSETTMQIINAVSYALGDTTTKKGEKKVYEDFMTKKSNNLLQTLLNFDSQTLTFRMCERLKKMLKGILKLINAGKDTNKIPLKKSQQTMADEVQKALDKAKKMKSKAKTNEEKIAATQADEAAKAKKRELADFKFTQAHLWEKVPTRDQVVKRIQNWTAKIAKMEMDLKHKDDNKEVSLGTSK